MHQNLQGKIEGNSPLDKIFVSNVVALSRHFSETEYEKRFLLIDFSAVGSP